jgi:hypothetical protein
MRKEIDVVEALVKAVKARVSRLQCRTNFLIEPPYSNEGEVDAMFWDPDVSGVFYVVEVKFLDFESTGHTAREKKRQKQRDVIIQAKENCRRLTTQNPVISLIRASILLTIRASILLTTFRYL